jgi:hypothetical protein
LLAANNRWSWWQSVLAVAGAFGIAMAVWAAVNRWRGRPMLRLPDDLGPVEVSLFVLVPAAIPLIFGGQARQALAVAAGNVLLVALIYIVTSYGLVPMTRWGLGQIVQQVQSVFTLFIRALPLLILVLALLLFTTEVWQTASDLNATKIVLVVALFVVIGGGFAAARLPQQISELATFESWSRTVERVEGTPIEPVVRELAEPADAPASLSRRQWQNVGLVVLVSEALQVLLVSLSVFLFFVVFGMLTLTQSVMAEWVDQVDVLWRVELFDNTFVLTEELVKVSMFLAAFSGLYFMVVLLTDVVYRREFLDEVVSDVRDAFAVRAAYLAYLGPAARR